VGFIYSLRDSIIRGLPLQRRLERSIRVPGLPARSKIPGSVWGICLAKNEADIIEHTVRHFLNQGLDGLIVVDNGSSDSTVDVLRKLASEDDRLFVGEDLEPAFHQGRKTSYLAHLAWRAGADWIVPFDADEQWFAPEVSLPDFLRSSQADVVACAMYNVYPATADKTLDLSSAHTLRMESLPTNWAKIAFHARPWVWVREGNHEVRYRGTRGAGLKLRHFQYRSPEQVARKVIAGSAAIAHAFGRSTGVAAHWRDLALMSEEGLRGRWDDHLRGEKMMEGQTVSPLVTVNAEEPWLSWDPHRELGERPRLSSDSPR